MVSRIAKEAVFLPRSTKFEQSLFLPTGELSKIPQGFYRPPAFSIALMMILFASSPERFVTVKCATDCRCRVFFFASTEISVICIATRGARRSTIVMPRSFSFAKVSPHKTQPVYVIVVETSTCGRGFDLAFSSQIIMFALCLMQ